MLWTVGYDTIYAHQDKEDDLLVGLKSTALRLGEATPRWLVALLRGCRSCCGEWRARWPARGWRSFWRWRLAAVQLAWQVATLDTADPANCLARFKSNRLIGWLLLAGLAADMALVAFADAHY